MKFRKSFPQVLLLIGTILVTGCSGLISQNASPSPTQINATVELSSEAEESVEVPASPTPTAGPTNTPDALEEAFHDTAPPTATPLPVTPFVLEIPTPGLKPVSAWRPPLYEVPMALKPQDHFYFTRPIGVDNVNWALESYGYGATYFGEDHPHTGIDIVVDEGTPVYAVGPGYVEWTGYGIYYGNKDENDPYGKAVVIRHDFGYNGEPLYTIYGHLSEFVAVRGQKVETGDLIAYSGDTGLTTGPHLHFEIRTGENAYWNTYNPILWMAPPQGYGVLVGRIVDWDFNPITSPEGDALIFDDGSRVRITNVDTGERWWTYSYGSRKTIHSDEFYDENFVLGDLPEGNYELYINYQGTLWKTTIHIFPGTTNYFTFNPYSGFGSRPPLQATPANLPTPTPVPED